VECVNEENDAKEIGANSNKRMPGYLNKTMRRNTLRYYTLRLTRVQPHKPAL
jgi:hypothetical protein